MRLDTVGKQFYTGYSLPICVFSGHDMLLSPFVSEYYKILLQDHGTLHLSINGKEHILLGPHVICMSEKDRVSICREEDTDTEVLFFHPCVINTKFDFDAFLYMDTFSGTEYQDLFYLTPFSDKINENERIFTFSGEEISAMKKRFNRLRSELEKQDSSSWPCRSRSFLFEILFGLNMPEKTQLSAMPTRIESGYTKLTADAIFYLQNYYHQKTTVDELAKVLHTNRTTLLADFKKCTGVSINRYVTQLRMTMAAALLRDTQLSVNEICERTGFGDTSYFSRSFKRTVQYSPSEYRRICVS